MTGNSAGILINSAIKSGICWEFSGIKLIARAFTELKPGGAGALFLGGRGLDFNMTAFCWV